jgi:hypothetical protein
MSYKKGVLDCDGVILNFYGAMLNMAKKSPSEKTNSWYTDWITPYYQKVQENYEFWSTLTMLLPDSNQIPFDFGCYLTAVPEGMEQARKDNLTTLGFPDRPVVRCKDKWKWCKDNNIYFIVDDRPSTCREFRENWEQEGDPIAIQFIPPYANRWPVEGHYSIRSLQDMLRFNFVKPI